MLNIFETSFICLRIFVYIAFDTTNYQLLLVLHCLSVHDYVTLWSRPKCETLCCRKSKDANIWWRQHVV